MLYINLNDTLNTFRKLLMFSRKYNICKLYVKYMNTLKLKPPFLLLINGKQGSGKSHFINYIMRENMLSPNKWDYGIVFSNTCWENGSWEFLPEAYVYEEYNEKILDNLMKIQKQNLEKNINTHAFVIFDDCLDDKDQFTSTSLKKLSTQLRHYNISLIISTQYPHLVPPRFRANSMYAVFFDIGSGVRELEALYNAYGQRFRNYNEFKEYYYKNISDHKFIMYNKDEDKYQTYRCPSLIPKFAFKYNKFK